MNILFRPIVLLVNSRPRRGRGPIPKLKHHVPISPSPFETPRTGQWLLRGDTGTPSALHGRHADAPSRARIEAERQMPLESGAPPQILHARPTTGTVVTPPPNEQRSNIGAANTPAALSLAPGAARGTLGALSVFYYAAKAAVGRIMRVLLLDHFPLASSPSGRHLREIADLLQARGHEPRALVVGPEPQPREAFDLRVMTCGAGGQGAAGAVEPDVPFALPGFTATAGQRLFEDLSESELADYREALRRRLDEEMADFDPQLIHAQYVWLGGQLALESARALCAHGLGPGAGHRGPRPARIRRWWIRRRKTRAAFWR